MRNITPTMDANVRLREINDEYAEVLTPAVIIFGVLMAMGLFGNPLVIYVYGYRMKASASFIFITTLACFDLIACVTSIPIEIVDITHYYTFEDSLACRSLRFINYFTCISSGLTLIVVAVDRYRKLCKPFEKQISIKMAKIILAMLCAVSLISSFPSIIMYSSVKVNITDNPQVIGHDCRIIPDEEFRWFVTIYNAYLFLAFVITLFVLVILYSLIGRQLFKLRRFRHKSIKVAHKSKKNNSSSRSGHSTDLTLSETYSSSTSDNKEKNELQNRFENLQLKQTSKMKNSEVDLMNNGTFCPQAEQANCVSSASLIENNDNIRSVEQGKCDKMPSIGKCDFSKDNFATFRLNGIDTIPNHGEKSATGASPNDYQIQKATAGVGNYTFKNKKSDRGLIKVIAMHPSQIKGCANLGYSEEMHDSRGVILTKLQVSSRETSLTTIEESKGDTLSKTSNQIFLIENSNISKNGNLEYTKSPVTRNLNSIKGSKMSIQDRGKYRNMIKTRVFTMIALAISVTFVISFLPFLILLVYTTLIVDYDPYSYSDAELILVELFLRSFLFNSALNPIVYAFVSTEFRTIIIAQAKTILSACCCCFTYKSDDISTGGPSNMFSP